uniref:Uncharacterized protein n=1 Tax=Lepeophtheirus salmonis TaxID=72036 RepID=A0A0K2U933_LEPSM
MNFSDVAKLGRRGGDPRRFIFGHTRFSLICIFFKLWTASMRT